MCKKHKKSITKKRDGKVCGLWQSKCMISCKQKRNHITAAEFGRENMEYASTGVFRQDEGDVRRRVSGIFR